MNNETIMNEQLQTLDIINLNSLTTHDKQITLSSLESGKVIYFPSYFFDLKSSEKESLLSENILDGKHKNISFDYTHQRLGGFHRNNADLATSLKAFMRRYAEFAKNLVNTTLPQYQETLRWGRTSYRPAEIKGRVISKRKDDTRLHVDSFPATPVNGWRILRVFCNINPHQPRTWHLGEPFADVFKRFSSEIPAYNRIRAQLLHWFKITKTLRSPYDHYQLNLHDNMKLNDEYQKTVKKQPIDFPAQSTWMVFPPPCRFADRFPRRLPNSPVVP